MCTCIDVPASSSKEEGGEKSEGDGETEKEKSKEDERLIITHIPVLPPR